MTVFSDRKIDILDFIIRDYIKHGVPVASGRVHKKTSINAAPATIRNIMCGLDDDGYLKQPHTSGGRIPTNKAYRYFVDSLIDIKEPHKVEDEIFDEMDRAMSEATKLFTVMADFGEKKSLHFYGARQLLEEPEFEDHDLMQSFASIFDNLYETADVYRQAMDEERVFIGRENPIKETQMMSVVGGRVNNKNSESVLLIIGPTRMDYEHNCSTLRYFFQKLKSEQGERL